MSVASAATDAPGTFTDGWVPPPLHSFPVPETTAKILKGRGASHITTWTMGETRVTRYNDPVLGLTMMLGRDDRLPSWDEVKWARYRLLPLDRWFGMALPPPNMYVDDPRNPFVFELHEIEW